MKEKAERISQPPWVGVPVGLVTSKASDLAILCFVAMGSFGPESRATVLSIGKRMRRTAKARVRQAQKELLELGFICLTKEATPDSPREWSLWPHKGGGGAESNPPTMGEGGQNLTPQGEGRICPPKQITNQTDKEIPTHAQESSPIGSLKGNQAIVIFLRMRQESKLYPTEKYIITGPDKGRLRDLLQSEVQETDFTAKARGYFLSREPFEARLKHPLSLFCSQFNKWTKEETWPSQRQDGSSTTHSGATRARPAMPLV